MLTPEQKNLLRRHVSIDGDGNVVGNDNTVHVTKQTTGDYAIQIGEQYNFVFNIVELRRVQALHQIPEPPTSFKDRQEELNKLIKAIREGGATISGVRGMGGIGKTALVLKLAHQLAPDYPDAQIFIDLDGTSPSPVQPVQAMAHVVHAFHPQLELPTTEGELGGLYRSVLHGQRALLLLDDAADAEQVKPLIPPASCVMLITSRRRFRLPGMYALNLNTLDETDALDLLRAIAPRISDAAPEIAELCGCLPMALELAASALSEREDLTPAEYAHRLREERARLDLVDASLSLSYDLLDEAQQRLWTRLAVFTIPFNRAAAAAVGEMVDDLAHDLLGELLRYSLVEWKGEIKRYQFHNLAQVFAYAKLEGRENPHLIHRLAAGYLKEKIADEELPWTPEERLEEVNQWERAQAWEEMAHRASALVGSLDRVGYWNEIQERLERGRAAVEENLDEPKLEATLLNDLGIVARMSGEWDRAIELFQQSLENFERLGDVHGMATAWMGMGVVYAQREKPDLAIEMFQKSLEAFERVGDVHGRAQTWMGLGSEYRKMGKWDRAIEMWELCLEAFERVGDVHSMAQTWMGLGNAYQDKRKWGQAIEMYQKSLKIFERVGDVHSMAQTLNNLSNLYAEKRDWDRAIEMCQQSLEGLRRVGDIFGVARASTNLGFFYLRTDRAQDAKPLLAQAFLIFAQLGSPHAQTAADALVQACGGSVDAANAYLEEVQRQE
jgi:tetratricopeptide (TPR) repeat protein